MPLSNNYVVNGKITPKFRKPQSIQNALVVDGYHEIAHPWTDLRNVGFDYGEKNLTGMGGCNEGEFRDQNFIYPPNKPHQGSIGWHILQQLNEPNPELQEYDLPIFWWGVYTTFWHWQLIHSFFYLS